MTKRKREEDKTIVNKFLQINLKIEQHTIRMRKPNDFMRKPSDFIQEIFPVAYKWNVIHTNCIY